MSKPNIRFIKYADHNRDKFVPGQEVHMTSGYAADFVRLGIAIWLDPPVLVPPVTPAPPPVARDILRIGKSTPAPAPAETESVEPEEAKIVNSDDGVRLKRKEKHPDGMPVVPITKRRGKA